MTIGGARSADLIQAVAGLALVGAFSDSAVAAFQAPDTRKAAAITFLVTASGVSFGGISGAFWGAAWPVG